MDKIVFSKKDLALLISIVASVDVNAYLEDDVKAVIYKCKSMPLDKTMNVVVTNF
jgi:hypothetical protein